MHYAPVIWGMWQHKLLTAVQMGAYELNVPSTESSATCRKYLIGKVVMAVKTRQDIFNGLDATHCLRKFRVNKWSIPTLQYADS